MPDTINPERAEDRALSRAKWTAAKRKAYYEKHPENFAGEGDTYPIEDGSDVADAWGLAGHADNPGAVRAKIQRIAKRLGLESSLPDTATDDTQERAMPPTHPPFTGTHSHPHTADGEQGDDATHDHEHSHDNDAVHEHSHEERAIPAPSPVADGAAPLATPTSVHAPQSGSHAHSHTHADGTKHSHSHSHSEDNEHEHEHGAERSGPSGITPFNVYLPITRSDATQRRVFGQATVEQPDAYNTIFGYYPEAWQQWRGNIREQHDPKKAVGKALEVMPDPNERAIFVDAKVSRGAQDTWLKVEDGVLTGFSASILPDPEYGSDTRKWPRKEWNGKQYPYLPRYSVVELSLVDNPATPGCNISIVRANGMATDVLDVTEEEQVPPVEEAPKPVERAGARISQESQSAIHDARNSALQNAMKLMSLCKCDQCKAASSAFDPDGDGDIDIYGLDDPDGDSEQLSAAGVADTRKMEERLLVVVERLFQPLYARFQAIAGQFARNNTANTESVHALERSLQSHLGSALDERARQQSSDFVSSVQTALDESLVRVLSSLDEVRTVQTVVKDQVDKIAQQPQSGGPVLNGAYPVEKRLATDPSSYAPAHGADARKAVFDELQRKGLLNTQELQLEAAKAMITPMPGRFG